MKMYSNQPRKPMMGGGMAMSRMKRMSGTPENQQGEQRNPEGPTTIGSIQGATKEQEQMQRRETLTREIRAAKEANDTATLNRFMKAANSPRGDGPIIKGILQRMGMAGMAPAPQESSGMMYGGMAGKKKMMYGGKAKKGMK